MFPKFVHFWCTGQASTRWILSCNLTSLTWLTAKYGAILVALQISWIPKILSVYDDHVVPIKLQWFRHPPWAIHGAFSNLSAAFSKRMTGGYQLFQNGDKNITDLATVILAKQLDGLKCDVFFDHFPGRKHCNWSMEIGNEIEKDFECYWWSTGLLWCSSVVL